MGLFQVPISKGRGIFGLSHAGIGGVYTGHHLFIWLGCWLTLGDIWLYPLFLLHLVIGVYLGRDVAIFAHYNMLITIGVLGGGLLLLNILPPSIAERLKVEHMALADGYTEVSILFADIVSFTKMSATMSPERLVEVLNKLFSRFDLLCENYGAEKIKTIGDAYMVCAGLPEPRSDHAQAIANLALAMQDALVEHNQEFGSDLKIRIGINSGPLVAGVIGLKKFIYGLWGDAVMASRMESTGIPNRIQVSTATWKLLRDHFVFEAPRTLDIKGLGSTDAYLLTG